MLPLTFYGLQALDRMLCVQNGTLHLWYSKSHSACSWVSSGGVCWAPGGDMLFSTSQDMGQTWNTTVWHCL